MKHLLSQVLEVAKGAGEAIMAIYKTDYESYEKADESPLTAADLASHHHIVAELEKLSDLPILSEESTQISWQERQQWDSYWLIDPLDGTKEFIKGNGEFTVNIALIQAGKAVLGVVHAPALNLSYYAAETCGAFMDSKEELRQKIEVREPPKDGSHWQLVGSRSHGSDEMQRFMAQFKEAQLSALGSSLKLCAVACGKADLYPRLGLTSEWDTAAAQCVVEQAGGLVLDRQLKPIVYNQKESILNPHFIVCAQVSEQWTKGL